MQIKSGSEVGSYHSTPASRVVQKKERSWSGGLSLGRADPSFRERIVYRQPTGLKARNYRNGFSRPALRDGSLNSLFQVALYPPSCITGLEACHQVALIFPAEGSEAGSYHSSLDSRVIQTKEEAAPSCDHTRVLEGGS